MFEKQIQLETSASDINIGETIYYYATVVDINDPLDCRRIKARIKGIDDKIPDSQLPWCTQFLPLFFIPNPKIGELVKIFYPSKKDIMNKREWHGPIITSFNNLQFESARTALSNQAVSDIPTEKSLKNTPSANGAYIDNKDIGIQGRDNTDLIFKDKEVLIRAGKFVFNDKTKVNTKNPSYIQLKLKTDGSTSYASLVADKICLISHNGPKSYNTILNEDELKRIIESAYSAAYAEPIVEFLKLVQNFVVNHIHPQNLPANKAFGKINEISTYDLNKIIANNLKIN